MMILRGCDQHRVIKARRRTEALVVLRDSLAVIMVKAHIHRMDGTGTFADLRRKSVTNKRDLGQCVEGQIGNAVFFVQLKNIRINFQKNHRFYYTTD